MQRPETLINLFSIRRDVSDIADGESIAEGRERSECTGATNDDCSRDAPCLQFCVDLLPIPHAGTTAKLRSGALEFLDDPDALGDMDAETCEEVVSENGCELEAEEWGGPEDSVPCSDNAAKSATQASDGSSLSMQERVLEAFERLFGDAEDSAHYIGDYMTKWSERVGAVLPEVCSGIGSLRNAEAFPQAENLGDTGCVDAYAASISIRCCVRWRHMSPVSRYSGVTTCIT